MHNNATEEKKVDNGTMDTEIRMMGFEDGERGHIPRNAGDR